MPKYAKFMKDILTQRGRGNKASKITLNERCSAVVLKEIPLKEKDHKNFTIPCVIGQSGINKALADLGASISLMTYSMFLRLNLGELKPTRMCIELANKSTQIPKGIAKNVIVKIDMFVFLVDFVVLNMKEDHKIPIILGTPFPPSDDDTCHSADIIDLSILDHVQQILPSEPFDLILFEPINHPLPTKINSLWDDNEEEQDLINQILGDLELKDYKKPTLFAANMFEGEKPTTKLKDLPSHLEYAFLDNNQEFPFIIFSLLSSQEKELLFGVLTKHKSALAWKVADIKGYFQITLAPEDQEKTTFTYPYGTFAYRRMPFGLCNAPATFQSSNIAILDQLEDIMGLYIAIYKVGLDGSYYWPTILKDSAIEVFDIWGIDFMRPFPSSRNNKYILVAIDYVSKWVEAEALPTNDARVVVKFLRKLFSRFGVAKALISDRGTHFCNSLLEKTLKKYGVMHRLATPYHPQISGQTENTNRAIKCILERTVNENRKEWEDKLDDALWAFRIAYKALIGSTPFRIVYGKACHLSLEMKHKAYWALKKINLDLEAA
ncbi:reverse transcriptase domain-containing protein [Tanacetum coccineum]